MLVAHLFIQEHCWHTCLLFWRFWIQLSALRVDLMTEVVNGGSQSLQEIAGSLVLFLQCPSKFTIHKHHGN
jgi:hypothetical protein